MVYFFSLAKDDRLSVTVSFEKEVDLFATLTAMIRSLVIFS